MSRRWIAIVVVVIAAIAFGTLVLRNMVYLPLPGGDPGIHDVASLPDRISVCGRDWSRDALDRQFSKSELLTLYGFEPAVVDPGLLAACPAGACSASAAASPCQTVIFVRVAEDAYVDYSLQGGP